MRRTLAFFVIAVILATGCSAPKLPSSKQASKSQASAGAPVTLKLGIISGLRGKPELDAVVAAFQNQNPNYRVDMVTLPSDPNAVSQAMSRGEVDLIQSGSAHLEKAVKAGAVADLSPYLRLPGVSTKAFDWFLNTRSDQSKILELPYFVIPVAVIYNRDLAKATGVSVPEDGWTWDQFRDMALRLSRQEGENRTWGLVNDAPWIPVTVWVKQAVGTPQTRASADSVKDALHFFSDLVFAEHSMAPLPADDDTGQEPEDLFAEGKAAMKIKSLPDSRSGQPYPFDWGVAPIPNLPGAKPVLFVQPWSLAMSANAPNPEGAWQFLKFLTGSEAAKVVAAAGSLPCYPSEEARTIWLQSRPGLPQSVRSLLDAQWIAMDWYLGGDTRDGLVFVATRHAFQTDSSWAVAAYEYGKSAKDAGIR